MWSCQHVRMKVCALISQKGGSGKTTLALNLAVAAVDACRSVVVIDVDPQQSAAHWGKLRTTDNPIIIKGYAAPLPDIIQRCKSGGADLVIIDTAPKSEKASLVAAQLANLIVIPCQPSSLDLHAVGDSVNIARLAQKPAVFVLNGCRANSTLTDDAADALLRYAATISPVRIGNRIAFVKALADGLGVTEFDPVSAAALETRALISFLKKQGGM